MELFEGFDFTRKDRRKPLADRMRPENLKEFFGQEHILGEGKLLRVLIEKKDIPSMIFWGPSGVGKTTLGWLIGKHLRLPFFPISAVSIGIKEVKDIIQKAKRQRIILFVDEFHRFNKLQQDTFLPHVESGDIILIGATTENPSFEIISPLLSRMRVITLNPLKRDDLIKIIKRAISEDVELKKIPVTIEKETIEELAILADGDARRALNILEVCYMVIKDTKDRPPIIDHDLLQEAYQKKIAKYDKKGDMHYDLISAFHKSMRGSDPDAALYWLVRMIEAGEDPLYIARRMVRFASEDVGNADPNALVITVSATEAFRFIGPPEGYLALAQACIYLSLSEKSNALYRAYNAVSHDIKNLPEYPVPIHLRNAPTRLMEELGHGRDYLYPHDYPEAIVEQVYMPEEIRDHRYYYPSDRGFEKKLKDFMDKVNRITKRKR
ncbi:MAG TPA: replication-associated recombination protein A [Syntrophorhabdaceae bacterium]|mgnify:CR=1 FL=1|nr:replication-associated recombination protein A [Syntrophorhabdaceae bacterium]HOL05538.1 replication-associated recombination protein A [Syntrophorhabdaceae bacterium]HON84904.1 replication-associated recombination protein A [Syntrophorhabdaceae bacterium]HOT41456.1 replication-associated recombination protein A [Syntrophorhabdaceae bacterium]HPC65989.1 replication-associated recombination protein A [Syntrophorhabdaceae bacterium]